MPDPAPPLPDMITPGWLAAVLRAGGCDARLTVSNIVMTPFGKDQGFSGCRIERITYAASHPAPRSLIAKRSPEGTAQRRRLAPAAAREVAFYGGAATGLPVPQCHFAGHDDRTGHSLLLLQDLGDRTAVPFDRGLTPDQAAMALRALARVHVQGGGVPDTLPEFPFATLWPDYLNRLGDLIPDLPLSPRLRAIGDRIAADPGLLGRHDGPLTRVHRDVQADNLRFGPGGAILLDWQMTGFGCGLQDAGYLLISSLTPGVRRAHEAALLRGYAAALDRPPSDLQRRYLRSVAGKLWMTVGATVLFDNDSPAKRAWRRTDLQRLTTFCDDHGVTPATFG